MWPLFSLGMILRSWIELSLNRKIIFGWMNFYLSRLVRMPRSNSFFHKITVDIGRMDGNRIPNQINMHMCTWLETIFNRFSLIKKKNEIKRLCNELKISTDKIHVKRQPTLCAVNRISGNPTKNHTLWYYNLVFFLSLVLMPILHICSNKKNAKPANSLTRISSRYSSTSKNLSRSHLTENRLDDELGTASIPATVWSSTVMMETFASFSMSDLSIDIGERMSCMHTGVSISCLISCNGNLYWISKIHFYVEFFSPIFFW